MAQLDDAFVLEFPVRLGHGVGIDDEPLGEGSNTRQLLAGSEGTAAPRISSAAGSTSAGVIGRMAGVLMPFSIIRRWPD